MDWQEPLQKACKHFPQHARMLHRRYIESLFQSRVCLIGTAVQLVDNCREVGWTIRKYFEAMAAGCLVIGDIPAELSIARFIPLRLSGQNAPEISMSAENFMQEFNSSKRSYFDLIVKKARNYITTHRTYDSIIDRYFTPAVQAYREKMKLLGFENNYRPMQSSDHERLSKSPIGVFEDSLSPYIVRNIHCSEKGNSTDEIRNFIAFS